MSRSLLHIGFAAALMGCSGAGTLGDEGIVPEAGTASSDTPSPPPSDSAEPGDADDPSDSAGPAACVEGDLCDDGDPCTTEDICQGGLCVGEVNLVCDEEGPCRTGICDSEAGGCVYSDVEEGTSCDVACFDEATCQAGSCEAVADSAVQCPSPDNPCIEALGCDQASGACTVEIYRPDGVSCDTDEDVCSLETCDGQGTCTPTGETETCASESADNPCWTYVCNGKSGCAPTNFVAGASCDDNNPCTTNDTCGENEFGQETCLGAPIPIDDQNPCTDDACVEGEITHTPLDGAVCDPQSPCSDTGTCADTVCQPTTPCACLQDSDCQQPESLCDGVMVCDTSGEVPACLIDPASVITCDAPTKACHTNTCNGATGLCEELPILDGTACTDENACTADDACLAGACVGGPPIPCDDGVFCNGVEGCEPTLGCQPGTAPEVSDGVDCTVDSCDAETDAPVHTPNDTLCDNQLYCDGAEVCAGAQGCQPGTPPELDDGVGCTTDTCDEATDQVTHTPDDSACDNDLFCDGAETCSVTEDCQPGDAPTLDDAVACTVDSCDEEADLVLHTPDPSLCDDENACTLESCDPTAGCSHTPTDAPCSDDDPCTGQDACLEGTCVGTPILKEGPVCNNVDDDCDGTTDEDCSFGIGGHVMGGGFVTATNAEGLTMDGSSGTRRFVGETKNDVFTLRSGLPPRGEEN